MASTSDPDLPVDHVSSQTEVIVGLQQEVNRLQYDLSQTKFVIQAHGARIGCLEDDVARIQRYAVRKPRFWRYLMDHKRKRTPLLQAIIATILLIAAITGTITSANSSWEEGFFLGSLPFLATLSAYCWLRYLDD